MNNKSIGASIYSSFNQAQKNIAEIMPIDYFFAKEVCSAIESPDQKISNFDDQVYALFHVFMFLSKSLRDGHTCLPLNRIANQTIGFHRDEQGSVTHQGFTIPNIEVINNYLKNINVTAKDNALIVYHQQALYLRRYFEFERELSGYISEKLTTVELTISEQQMIKASITLLFPQQIADEADEVDWQKLAVANAINKNFSIIAGGPGTGKTYTVIKLIAALLMLDDDNSLRIALVAPTGKAAMRLSESIVNAITGFRGQISEQILDTIPTETHTIHRLLGVIPNTPNFRHHQDNQLSLDVLIIDEVSMVDLALMTRLFRALPKHCKVIVLGDADQLPSVAAGSVLADIAPIPHPGYSDNNLAYLTQVTSNDLINKAEFNQLISVNKQSKLFADQLVILTKSRRFDGLGGIGLLAQSVITGNSKASWQLLMDNKHSEQLSLLDNDIDQWLPQLVKQYFQPMFSCRMVTDAFKCLARFRLLCATRLGERGVESLNDKVKGLLQVKGLIADSNALYQTQPIMISENDYRLGLFNGDIGIIWRNESGHLMAVFETSTEELKWVMPSRLPKFTTVYAMTIHKTQGSEFDHVAMVLPKNSDNRLLSRELLYTGITRARLHLSISSRSNVWQHGVEGQVKRYSGLKIS